MTAHAYAPSTAPAHEADRQPRLFALPSGAGAVDSPQRPVAQTAVAGPVAPTEPMERPALAAVPTTTPAPAGPASAAEAAALPGPARDARAGRTLDADLRLAWTALTAGAPAACLMCGGRMQPRTGAHGGACTSCGTTLE